MFFESLLSKKVMIGLHHQTFGVVAEVYIVVDYNPYINDLMLYLALVFDYNIGFSNT